MKRVIPILFGALLMSLLCAAGSAGAYVQYRTQAGQRFHWTVRCVARRVYTDDLPDMSPDQIMRAAEGAAAAWSVGANACSFVSIVVERATGTGPPANRDGV